MCTIFAVKCFLTRQRVVIWKYCKPLHGKDRKVTLVHLLDKSRTAMGGRLLRNWLISPLLDIRKIQRRQDAVAAFMDGALRGEIRGFLRQVADIERLSTKLAQKKINPS